MPEQYPPLGTTFPTQTPPQRLIPSPAARKDGWPPLAARTPLALEQCRRDAERWHELRSQDLA